MKQPYLATVLFWLLSLLIHVPATATGHADNDLQEECHHILTALRANADNAVLSISMTELCEGVGNLQAQKDTTMAQLASVGQLVHGLQESNRRLASEQKQCRQDSSRTLTEKQAAMLTCESKLIRADREARNCKRALDDSTAVKNELWERNDQCVVLVRDSNAAMVELIKEKEKLLQDNMELVEKCRRMGPLRLLRRLFVGGQRQEKTKQQ